RRAEPDDRAVGGRLEPARDGLAVGGADELSVDGPSGRGHRKPAEIDARGALGEQLGRVDCDAEGRELGEREQQTTNAVLARRVAGYGAVRSVPERFANEPREHTAGPDLDEDAVPRVVHRF